ncbi:MAG: 16S rRNA processing protein RimM [Magnetococcales bacterium]|nr:16S rRNA processing protein RimM [Magnetococcales bacterium]
MGRILGPFGVKGAVKVHSAMSSPADLAQWDTWWLGRSEPAKVAHSVLWCKSHGRGIIAGLEGVTDRDLALELVGNLLWVPLATLPDCEPGHYYWAELVGMAVTSRDGVFLGRVDHLFATGAQDVMVITDPARLDGTELMIPFAAEFVDDVDRNNRRIRINPLPGMLE